MSTPENTWPGISSGTSQKSQQKEKQHCAEEEPMLDNARKLRGIDFIDPEDKVFNETLKTCAKEVGRTNGRRNAVQIAKDLREYILKDAEGAKREKLRRSLAR